MVELPTSSFSGHETFAFRYGWLKKGVDAILRDPAAFSDPYAMVSLGVGKNMVTSIRHWCLTLRLVTPVETGASELKATALGQALFGPEGLDPYLEDTGTLWLLHWLLTNSDQRATTWRWAFGLWPQTEFTREQMLNDLKAQIVRQQASRVTETSLGRDVDTFLHTYLPTRGTRLSGAEDTLTCPLIELHLLRENPVNNHYEFIRGPKPTLPDAILGFALVEYWNHVAPDRETLTFEQISHGAGSPGRVFKLTEDALLERLERIDAWTKKAMLFDQTAGLRQVMRSKQVKGYELILPYYRATERSAA